MINKSCVRCGLKKLKCDGATPCSNCIRKNLSDECHRAIRKIRSKSDIKHDGSASSSASFSSQMQESPAYQHTSGFSISDVRGIEHGRPSSASQTHDTLLSQARHALGDAATCATLINRVFFWRINPIVIASIDSQAMQRDIELMYSDPMPRLSSDRLVLCMMVIAISWQYFPRDGSVVIENLNLIDGALTHRSRQKHLWQIVMDYTRHRMHTCEEDSFDQIQTVILLLIYDKGGTAVKDQLFDHAQRATKRLNLHTIVSYDSKSIEEETRVRSWWCLVTRSWFTSLHTSFYSINPLHFSTRMPRHLAELDVHPSKIGKLIQSYVTPLRFGLALIPLSDLVRDLVDHRANRFTTQRNQIVEIKFQDFWSKMPTDYCELASVDAGRDPVLDRFSRVITTEKWIVHQLLFHAFLELYNFEPTNPIPSSCIALARHILEVQTQVDSYCVVLSSLRINITNIVKACSLLALDLMQKGANIDIISRSTTLDQIHRALAISRASKVSKIEDFLLITEMLSHEAKSFQSRHNPSNPNVGHGSALLGQTNMNMQPANMSNSIAQAAQATPESNATSSGSSNDDLSWTSLLPSDSGIYPGLLANTVEEEWINAYEALFAMSK